MAHIKLGDKEYDLKVTMHRLKLLKEYSGVDIMNPQEGDGGLRTAEHMIAAVYAFAGGEATGVPREEFEDSIAMRDLPTVTQAINDVMAEDVGGGEGNTGEGEPVST